MAPAATVTTSSDASPTPLLIAAAASADPIDSPSRPLM